MGYYITQGSTKFSMRQENIPKALEALKKEYQAPILLGQK